MAGSADGASSRKADELPGVPEFNYPVPIIGGNDQTGQDEKQIDREIAIPDEKILGQMVGPFGLDMKKQHQKGGCSAQPIQRRKSMFLFDG